MSQSDYVKPQYPPDAFAGTATFYARYRIPYPRALLQDLVRRAGITGQGRLLDLACGPWRVAFGLVDTFREIWAIDLEPEMVAVGKEEAAQRGVHDWTLETILGNLYSLSVCSRRVLGSNADAFESELKAALLAHDPCGRYHEKMRFGYTLGRKPAPRFS